MNENIRQYYEGGNFLVTSADIKTPSIIYPISEAVVARVRRDVQFAALGFATLCGFALIVYFDLWFWYERLVMGGAMALSLIAAATFSILQIDARGYPSRLFFGRSKIIRRVFNAITEARTDSAPQSQTTYLDYGG